MIATGHLGLLNTDKLGRFLCCRLASCSTPRSLAIILLKWDRKYYKTKEECCQEQGNPPNCDCNWSGYTWDNLPPPKAYSRYFTDECDLGPSMNRVSVFWPLVLLSEMQMLVVCCWECTLVI